MIIVWRKSTETYLSVIFSEMWPPRILRDEENVDFESKVENGDKGI